MKIDQKGYHEKYIINRVDGKPLSRTFTIEIDEDPKSHEILNSLSDIYRDSRPKLANDLKKMANTVPKDNKWIKLTEDKSTWPKDGQVCWIQHSNIECANFMTWEFSYGRFYDFSEDYQYDFQEVTHWCPATPPEFDGENK